MADNANPVNEESAAAATIKMHTTAKTEMLNKALLALSGMSVEDLSHYLNDTLAKVGHEADAIDGGQSGENKATITMHPSAASSKLKESAKEDLANLLGEGDDLSEELKDGVSTLFEAAVETRLVLEREALIEEMNVKLEEAYEEMLKEMSEKLDAHLDAVVETWLTDNEVAIESSLRNEIMEDFIEGLHNLFAQHYMNVPEDKVDVVEEFAAKITDLEARLDTAIVENKALKNTVLESKKNDVVNSVCEGLALTQSEKLRSLVENVDFDGDLDAFTTKVNVLKESVVGSGKTETATTGILTEESDPDAAHNAGPVVLDPTIERYKQSISRSVRSK